MSNSNFRHITPGINVVPQASSNVAAQGDLDVDSSTGKANYHNGTTASPVVTEAHSATLTNKTIAAGSNTVTGLTNSNLSGSAGITGANVASATITGSNISSATIANSNLATMADQRIKGNVSGGVASPSDLTAAQINTMLGTTNSATSIGTFDTAASAAGLTLSSNVLSTQSASATNPGMVNTTTQTFAGEKTFTGAIAASNLSGTNTGNITLTAVGASPAAAGASLSGQALTLQPFDGTHPGVVPASGGGSTTFLRADGTWATSGGTLTGIGTIDGNTASNDGLSVSGANIFAQSASATKPGMVNTTTQTFAGAKTFSSQIATPTINDNGAGLAINGSNGQNISIVTNAGGHLKLNVNEGVDILEQGSSPSNPASGYSGFYPKTDHQFYKVDSSGNEYAMVPATAAIGTAGQFVKSNGSKNYWSSLRDLPSVRNYITNANAEIDTTGWATYSDGASNIPVDGTGGTATNLTFSRNTSSPLRASADFSLVQTNSSNIQGKGVSFAFITDSADQAKVLGIQFDYNASSTFVASDGITAPLNDGTVSTNTGNSDIEVFIYDVTNAVLIPVSPQVITANGSNNYTFKGVFQTASNSTSYRLILHVAKASANATGWTFKFDNVFVGPQSVSYGAPITDFTSYTPSSTQGFGTVTSPNFLYRRAGDSIEILASFITGTTSASEARISLPTGLTTDSAKMTANQKVGDVASSASSIPYQMHVIAQPNVTYLNFSRSLNSASGTTLAAGNDIWGSSVTVYFYAKVPISGWSSTIQISNDTDTRKVNLQVGLTSTYAASANAVVKYDTVIKDTHGGYSTSTGLYTIPVSGTYSVKVAASLVASQASIYLVKNSINQVWLVTLSTSGNNYGSSASVDCVAGDTIAIYSDTAKTFSATASSAYQNFLSIERVSGPSAIAATESVSTRYYSSSTSISGSLATITYATKDWDSHGAYSSGTFTCPTSGKYQVNAALLVAGTFSANNTTILELQKNGTVVTRDTTFAFASMTDSKVSLNDIINCVAGDTLRIQVSCSATLPTIVSSNYDNILSIARLGN